MTEREWIEMIAPLAVNAMNRFGYLASVLIAQTCLETGYGSGEGCEPLIEWNNVLGMKAELLNDSWQSDYWAGTKASKTTPEYYGYHTKIVDAFRVYATVQDCLYDYCQFMRDARYSPGGTYKYHDVLTIRDPEKLIREVSRRGYATDPAYAASVMRIIGKWSLTDYDAGRKEEKVMPELNIVDVRAYSRSQVPKWGNGRKYIVVHYLGVTGENNELWGGGYGAHYFIYKNGTVYWACDHDAITWQVGTGGYYTQKHPDARNSNCIGIECCVNLVNGRWVFTQATQESLVLLIRKLMDEEGIPIENVLRHYDVVDKECPDPYVRNDGYSTNWTWNQLLARVAGTDVPKKDALAEGGDPIILAGQRHSINFTGVPITVDGLRGPMTRKQAGRVLQKAMNLDYDAGLKEDGVIGVLSRGALDDHYVEFGEKQFMVTAAEILLMLLGKDPDGVECPGVFGNGLATAAGKTKITAEDFLSYLE